MQIFSIVKNVCSGFKTGCTVSHENFIVIYQNVSHENTFYNLWPEACARLETFATTFCYFKFALAPSSILKELNCSRQCSPAVQASHLGLSSFWPLVFVFTGKAHHKTKGQKKMSLAMPHITNLAPFQGSSLSNQVWYSSCRYIQITS